MKRYLFLPILLIVISCTAFNNTVGQVESEEIKKEVTSAIAELKEATDLNKYEKIEEFYKDYGDGNVSRSWDKVTIFYNKQGEKLFKFGLAYDNVQLLVRDVKNTQRSISNQKKEK